MVNPRVVIVRVKRHKETDCVICGLPTIGPSAMPPKAIQDGILEPVCESCLETRQAHAAKYLGCTAADVDDLIESWPDR